MNGEDATDVGSVRYWDRHFEGGEMDTGDRHLGAVAKSLARPAHSVTSKRGKCVLIMKVTSLQISFTLNKDRPT